MNLKRKTRLETFLFSLSDDTAHKDTVPQCSFALIGESNLQDVYPERKFRTSSDYQTEIDQFDIDQGGT